MSQKDVENISPQSFSKWETVNLVRVNFPIPIGQIPDFQQWINWNGFGRGKQGHKGFDFAAFYNGSKAILGLPPIEIQAILPGTVEETFAMGYQGRIGINHEKGGNWLGAHYVHIIPHVQKGQYVERGQTIGTLYSGEQGLTHLHLTLIEPTIHPSKIDEFNWAHRFLYFGYRSKFFRLVNPNVIFPGINSWPKAVPQERKQFRVPRLK